MKEPNIDLGKTRITDKVRVSSAAIFYEFWAGDYYQLETWVFSEDKAVQKSKQIIHGTCGITIPEKLIEQTKTFHRRASKLLTKKLTSL
jgi:hypothetical protein